MHHFDLLCVFSQHSSPQFTFADGTYAKPLMIVPNTELPTLPKEVNQDAFLWRGQPSGWITDEIFLEVLSAHHGLLDEIARRRAKLGLAVENAPAILFVDGHGSHVTDEVRDVLKGHNITLFVFVPHSTHITQPLDVILFGEYKKELKKVSPPPPFFSSTPFLPLTFPP